MPLQAGLSHSIITRTAVSHTDLDALAAIEVAHQLKTGDRMTFADTLFHFVFLFVAVYVLIIRPLAQSVNQTAVVFLQLYCSAEYDFLPGKGLDFPGLIKVRMIGLVELALPSTTFGCRLQMTFGKLRHVSHLVCQGDAQLY